MTSLFLSTEMFCLNILTECVYLYIKCEDLTELISKIHGPCLSLITSYHVLDGNEDRLTFEAFFLDDKGLTPYLQYVRQYGKTKV